MRRIIGAALALLLPGPAAGQTVTGGMSIAQISAALYPASPALNGFYTIGDKPAKTTTCTLSVSGNIVDYPFEIDHTSETFSIVAIALKTASTTTGTIEVGVRQYASGAPGTLIQDLGSISTIAVPAQVTPGTPITLTRGTYFMEVVTTALGTGTNAIVFGVNSSTTGVTLGDSLSENFLGSTGSGTTVAGANPNFSYVATTPSTTTPLPSTYPGGALSSATTACAPKIVGKLTAFVP